MTKKHVYVFAFRSIPTQGSEYHGKIRHAHTEIYVYDHDIDSAKTKALAHLMDYRLTPAGTVTALQLNDSTPREIDKDEALCIHLAKQRGIHAVFFGTPIHDREDGLTEIRSIAPPEGPTDERH